MTTATQSVAVVATRLPSLDRRALSQAWYSALHVAQTQPQAAVSKASTGGSGRSVKGANARPTAELPGRPNSATTRLTHADRPLAAATVMERRCPATELSRRIERALLPHARVTPEQPVTLTIKAVDGRVQLIVRNDGTTTRVVALCAPQLRERVDRALAHARFALAATGTRIEAAGA